MGRVSNTTKLIGGIAAACLATGTAWAFFDLPVPSTRAWTLAQVEQLRREQQEQRGVLYDIRRGQLDRNIIDLEKNKARRSTDEEFRLRQMKEDLRRLDGQIDQLRK